MAKKILITGGIKSGKSKFALQLAKDLGHRQKIFIATARAIDDEMRDKIEKHKTERGEGFKTVEEPLALGDILKQFVSSTVVIDCLTLWLSNLFFELSEDGRKQEIDNFINALKEFNGNLIIVSNEVGWGIIPGDEISRRYQSELGNLNQIVAEMCDEVYVLISGIELRIR